MSSREQSPACYPIFLNIVAKRCLVVGGGQVALRKVKMLREYGASVDVISPQPCGELVSLAGNGEINVILRSYRLGDLENATIAIAATDSRETNLEVVSEARERAVPVNVVDDAEISDFIVPSYLRRGEITIAISTAGRSPALARKIRARLEKDLGDEYADLARLIGEVRTDIRRGGFKVSGDAWQEALDLDLLTELLRRGEDEKARAILLNNLKARAE